ncbi:hypothetical protein ACU8MB_16265 [Rhizobium leguminosarum]
MSLKLFAVIALALATNSSAFGIESATDTLRGIPLYGSPAAIGMGFDIRGPSVAENANCLEAAVTESHPSPPKTTISVNTVYGLPDLFEALDIETASAVTTPLMEGAPYQPRMQSESLFDGDHVVWVIKAQEITGIRYGKLRLSPKLKSIPIAEDPILQLRKLCGRYVVSSETLGRWVAWVLRVKLPPGTERESAYYKLTGAIGDVPENQWIGVEQWKDILSIGEVDGFRVTSEYGGSFTEIPIKIRNSYDIEHEEFAERANAMTWKPVPLRRKFSLIDDIIPQFKKKVTGYDSEPSKSALQYLENESDYLIAKIDYLRLLRQRIEDSISTDGPAAQLIGPTYKKIAHLAISEIDAQLAVPGHAKQRFEQALVDRAYESYKTGLYSVDETVADRIWRSEFQQTFGDKYILPNYFGEARGSIWIGQCITPNNLDTLALDPKATPLPTLIDLIKTSFKGGIAFGKQGAGIMLPDDVEKEFKTALLNATFTNEEPWKEPVKYYFGNFDPAQFRRSDILVTFSVEFPIEISEEDDQLYIDWGSTKNKAYPIFNVIQNEDGELNVSRRFFSVISCVDINTLNGPKKIYADGWTKAIWVEYVSSDDKELPEWFRNRKRDLPYTSFEPPPP